MGGSTTLVGCVSIDDLPTPPPDRKGWPWTQGASTFPGDKCNASPKISIITPSFNQGKYIEETIRSVLLQGYANLEYIILDGGSSDETVKIIQKYERWITFWRSRADDGQVAAIDEGFSLCHGEILNWLNSDDVLLPGAVKNIVAMYDLIPSADIFTGARLQITEEGATFCVQNTWIEVWHDYLIGIADFPQESTFFTRKIYDQVGGLDRRFSFMFDVAFFTKILRFTKSIGCTRMPLSKFRVYREMKTLQVDVRKERERELLMREYSAGIVGRRIHSFASRRSIARPIYSFINRYIKKKTITEVYYDVLNEKWNAAIIAE